MQHTSQEHQPNSPRFKMNAIQKNDSIILKGTNFKSKPIFASFRYPTFDGLVRHLMTKYGETIPTSRLLKGKDYIFWDEGGNQDYRPVSTSFKPYFFPFYHSMLLVVGSDENDTLILTSPIANNVRKYFGFSRWSSKDRYYGNFLQAIERDTWFDLLTYNRSVGRLKEGWHKTVHLRKCDKVELYVVPKPLEYFPMLFINCSLDNARHLYDNITTLMISRNDPLYYCPLMFTCAIFRPMLFRAVDNHIEHKQRLPGIDVTDDQFVVLRTEFVYRAKRCMVSDCKCRSNTALIQSDKRTFIRTWHLLEIMFSDYYLYRLSNIPPIYASYSCKCDQHKNENKKPKEREEPRE